MWCSIITDIIPSNHTPTLEAKGSERQGLRRKKLFQVRGGCVQTFPERWLKNYELTIEAFHSVNSTLYVQHHVNLIISNFLVI